MTLSKPKYKLGDQLYWLRMEWGATEDRADGYYRSTRTVGDVRQVQVINISINETGVFYKAQIPFSNGYSSISIPEKELYSDWDAVNKAHKKLLAEVEKLNAEAAWNPPYRPEPEPKPKSWLFGGGV